MINVPQRFAGCIFMPENNANVCEISKKQKHQKTEVSTKESIKKESIELESIDKRKHRQKKASKKKASKNGNIKERRRT